MELGVILPESRIAEEVRKGFWPGRVLTGYLDDAVAAAPERIAIAARNGMTGVATTLTYAGLNDRVTRIAAGLLRLGVGRGEVVSFQLPNWWEFVALVLACVRIGTIANPLAPILRHNELRFMLGLAETRVLVVPRHWRHFDYPAMAQGLRRDLPHLAHVIVVGGEGPSSFEAALLAPAGDDAPLPGRQAAPNDVVQLLYTSGTTGEPKGVMHTSNTLLSSLGEFSRRYGLGSGDVVLMPSPFAHQIGFLYGILMALLHRTTLVALDQWHPATAARLIADWGVTFTLASTPFLADLTDLPDLGEYDIASLRLFACGGAPIPPSLVERAARNLGAHIVAVWGMTENCAATGTLPGDLARACRSDGAALPGLEVRVVGLDGAPLLPGTAGALQTRGSANFVGYLKHPELYATDRDGWFDTGDLATMEADGYIRIVGRSKDIIIRGGENIPVMEIEDLLHRHPAVKEAAVVAMPDARLGERPCAFVTTRDGRAVTLAELVAFLTEQGLATHYFPERLEVIDAMPRTPSGKIQKFRLREIAGRLVA